MRSPMKAIRVDQAGGPETLRLAEVPDARPRDRLLESRRTTGKLLLIP